MPLEIDWVAELIKVTSPTTEVDGQTLHDFIEDEMASPVGGLYGDIIDPKGKVEDPTNPGVYSQIIMVLNSPWQIQFWGGSGYTRLYGAKIVGGLADEVMKATGTAGDITVLESPVDGVLAVTGSAITPGDLDDIADAVWDEAMAGHTAAGSFGEAMLELLGLAGENVKWSSLSHDANDNLIGATITQYTDNTLVVPVQSWVLAATYSGRKMTSYQLKEV